MRSRVLQQKEDETMDHDLFSVRTTRTSPGTACSWSGLSARTPTKCVLTPGRLMLPGSQITWDIHYHSVGEEVKDATVELGIWFYPKGQEPKHREVLALFNTFLGQHSSARAASTSRRTP